MGHIHSEEFRREAVRIAQTSGLTPQTDCIRFRHWLFDIEQLGSVDEAR